MKESHKGLECHKGEYIFLEKKIFLGVNCPDTFWVNHKLLLQKTKTLTHHLISLNNLSFVPDPE